MSTLGLMTNACSPKPAYTRLADLAERQGFEATLLFHPRDVDVARRRVRANRYHRGRWEKPAWLPWPDIVHDVGFYTNAHSTLLARRVKSLESGLPFTGYALGHKWTIHHKLLQTIYAKHLPETELLRSPKEAVRFVKRFGAAVVKPRDGKQGKGIVKMSQASRSSTRLRLQEGAASFFLTPDEAADWLRRRFRPGKAIVQRWMDIRCPNGSVYDIRALMQKNEAGEWQLTELGVRQSGIGRIASNLAAGAVVRPAAEFLAQLYGFEEGGRIAADCIRIAKGLPAALEAAYGKRFAELGIDLAVERGAVRIIEANIKPGKKIVRALSGEKAYADAIERPIRYAKRLSDRRDCLEKGS